MIGIIEIIWTDKRPRYVVLTGDDVAAIYRTLEEAKEALEASK